MRLVTMFTLAALLVAVLSFSGAGTLLASAPPALTQLHFLLGKWEAIPQDKPGEPSGSFVFAPSLQDRIILRTNYAEYPATENKPASTHTDLMIIYLDDASRVRADYYDSEGHVIRYAVQPAGSDSVVFLSDAAPSAPRFRLTYSVAADSTLKGQFEIAQPGKPGAFGPYLSWAARRVK